MTRSVVWDGLSTARIGTQEVIPAIGLLDLES
jgi:hypothetical protein